MTRANTTRVAFWCGLGVGVLISAASAGIVAGFEHQRDEAALGLISTARQMPAVTVSTTATGEYSLMICDGQACRWTCPPGSTSKDGSSSACVRPTP